MPKELIYPPHSDPENSRPNCRVEVGWHHVGEVQIATTSYQDPSNTEAVNEWDGQFVDLSRRQINDLIRALRKARDSAFGRDE